VALNSRPISLDYRPPPKPPVVPRNAPMPAHRRMRDAERTPSLSRCLRAGDTGLGVAGL